MVNRYVTYIQWQCASWHIKASEIRIFALLARCAGNPQVTGVCLVQDCSISSALAMEILTSCTKPSTCPNDISPAMIITLTSHTINCFCNSWSTKWIKHHWGPVDSPHKGSVLRKAFTCQDVTTCTIVHTHNTDTYGLIFCVLDFFRKHKNMFSFCILSRLT